MAVLESTRLGTGRPGTGGGSVLDGHSAAERVAFTVTGHEGAGGLTGVRLGSSRGVYCCR